MVVKIDQLGHVLSYGNIKTQDPALAIGLAKQQESNRSSSHGVTGRLSSSGGVARVVEFQAVPGFSDVDVATGTLGPTKATLDASLALVNDALAAMFVDANAIAAVLGISQVTYAGGGTAASPIADITDSGTLAATGPVKATMDPIRDQINTNMHTIGALVNKALRAVGHNPVAIESSPYRQPPPDDYKAGSTGANPPGSPPNPVVKGGGSGLAFGAESPFTDPTPAITEDSGTFNATGITKVAMDAALTIWRDNVETLATRLAVATNTVVALTDSSTGTAAASIEAVAVFPANTPDSAVSLAGKTTTDAEMVDIRTGIVSLFAKANALAAGLGVPERTYDGGGTASDTLPAIGAVTAVATGAQFTEMEAFRVDVEDAFDALAEHVNEIADVVDVVRVVRVTKVSSFPFDNPVNPLQETSQSFAPNSGGTTRFLTSRLTPVPGSTIPVTSGTAADPGQQKTDVDTRFTSIKNNIATMGAKINDIRSALAAPLVKII